MSFGGHRVKVTMRYKNFMVNLTPACWKFSTRTGGHEINHRVIEIWKYIRTGINEYFKNQFENHSKIDSSV